VVYYSIIINFTKDITHTSMVDYEKPKDRPEIGKFFAFDHLKFYVGNAKQAASFYTSRFGF